MALLTRKCYYYSRYNYIYRIHTPSIVSAVYFIQGDHNFRNQREFETVRFRRYYYCFRDVNIFNHSVYHMYYYVVCTCS